MLSLEELTNISLSLAYDQSGCRYLQKLIETNDSFTNEYLFPKIKPSLMSIMNDAFGNYLIQKMIEKLNNDNLNNLISIINKNFLELAKNPQGTRVIQKLTELSKCETLNNNMLSNALDLFKDNNGYHIILKYSALHNKSSYVGRIVEDNLLEIAKNKFGCCALQKYLQTFPDEIIIRKIINYTTELIVDTYGNYVIQYVISMNNQEYNINIVEMFKNNISFLSKQKFSSNVIERCFDYCKDSVKDLLINYICDEKTVSNLLMDMYGNYGKVIIN